MAGVDDIPKPKFNLADSSIDVVNLTGDDVPEMWLVPDVSVQKLLPKANKIHFVCPYCGVRMTIQGTAEFDHTNFIPIHKGEVGTWQHCPCCGGRFA